MAEQKQVFIKPVALDYHYDIIGPIADAEQYNELFEILRTASEKDVVYLHINSPGGDLMTTVQIINAMRMSEAQIVTCAEGDVASGASMLFFSGTGFMVSPHAMFMLHDGAAMAGGKFNENLKAAQANAELLRRVYHDVYGGFFTPEEIDGVLEGKDIWIIGEDIMPRLEGALDAEAEALQGAEAEGQVAADAEA